MIVPINIKSRTSIVTDRINAIQILLQETMNKRWAYCVVFYMGDGEKFFTEPFREVEDAEKLVYYIYCAINGDKWMVDTIYEHISSDLFL